MIGNPNQTIAWNYLMNGSFAQAIYSAHYQVLGFLFPIIIIMVTLFATYIKSKSPALVGVLAIIESSVMMTLTGEGYLPGQVQTWFYVTAAALTTFVLYSIYKSQS